MIQILFILLQLSAAEREGWEKRLAGSTSNFLVSCSHPHI